MSYSITQSFISGQPPLLVFTICLMAFGLTMVVLAYLIGEQEVPNPDVQMDWNKLFLKISGLHLCISPHHLHKIKDHPFLHHNLHDAPSNLTYNSSQRHIIDESRSLSAVLSNVVDGATDSKDAMTMVNVSVKVKFGVSSGLHLLNSFSLFKGNVTGKQLGFSGKFALQSVYVTLNFQRLLNVSCESGCHTTQEVCMTFSLPSSSLPQTRNPEKCQLLFQDQVIPTYFVDSNVDEETCVALDYTPDPKLTEMLSFHDRSVVNLHLMHTSYFMFVMVMTLLCFSLIRGRYRHQKNFIPPEKMPLDA